MVEESCPIPAPGARRCKPCEGGVAPIGREKALERLGDRRGWELSDDGREIRRTFELKDFAEAIGLVNAVAAVAEREGH
ncbi:MAG: 4a-hydroxytetrahydrobiopterin dehydratase, partial [Planctomycetes bacterium]|nr:4a-hydroxytetrahydrobiopterin dehydratase [Planctomycetota bacterium]